MLEKQLKLMKSQFNDNNYFLFVQFGYELEFNFS